MIQVGNAPCSWGTIEGFEASPVAYDQMLDELKVTGYEGTELGDLGFMPADPERLRDTLKARDLVMLGGYEGVRLVAAELSQQAWERIHAVAGLLAACGDVSTRKPYFIRSIDFPAIVARLRERGYDDWITVEQDVLPGMGTPKESARRNRAFLREMGL